MGFDNDEVVGHVQEPGYELIQGPPPPARHRSLIEVPPRFENCVEKMLEDGP
jgi:hypothetical protein